MRFLVDAQLPLSLARWLSANGHEGTHLLDQGLLEAADTRIWEVAERLGAVIISSSFIMEVAGEALESVSGPVRVVCNSIIDPKDIETAKKAAQAAMRREWCDSQPERLPDAAKLVAVSESPEFA